MKSHKYLHHNQIQTQDKGKTSDIQITIDLPTTTESSTVHIK